ncbi:hypothetical protein [Kitasatospora sp. NPDC094011]|uniref:hypothetical protein n=1 Tax=Kitasatospora sp. NPDC094011 TaxID=3364090 RepID=UPI0037F671D5
MTDRPEQAPAPLHVFLSDAAEAALALLRPSELDAVEKLVERLALYLRLGIPVPGGTDPEVDDYTARTDPASDSGDRISAGREPSGCRVRLPSGRRACDGPRTGGGRTAVDDEAVIS